MGKIYGIDLGTTNSLIGYRDTYLSDIVPSIVDITQKKAGESQRENYEAIRSFKIDISLGLEGNRSVAASRYVLEELKRQVKDDIVKDVVISVPAYFSDNQRSATKEAAKLAGLNVLRLVPEPTAAALYITHKRKCLALVCDLGGGTFDASAIDSRFGDYCVLGKNGAVLGGDDFDRALMNHIIKLAKIKTYTYGKDVRVKLAQLKEIVSSAKIQLQKTKADVTIPLYDFGVGEVVLTVDSYKSIMMITFERVITVLRDVIASCITNTDTFELFMVGGSTHCPYFREWVATELGKEPADLTYDPDRVVAQGAAMYAAMIESGEIDDAISDVTSGIGIEMADGTLNYIIPNNSSVPVENTTFLRNNIDSNKLEINLYQGSSLLPENNECIGTLRYDYERFVPAGEGSVFVQVSVNTSGIVTLTCREPMRSPQEIIIDRTASKIRKE